MSNSYVSSNLNKSLQLWQMPSLPLACLIFPKKENTLHACSPRTICHVSAASNISVMLVLHTCPAALCALCCPLVLSLNQLCVFVASFILRYDYLPYKKKGYRGRSLISLYCQIRTGIGDLLGATRR